VVYLDSDDKLVVTNQGDGSVFAAYAMVQMDKEPPWTRQDLPIYSVIEPSEFKILDLKQKDLTTVSNEESTRFIRDMAYDEFLQEVDKGMLDEACYNFSFHDPISLDRIRRFTGSGLNTLPTIAYIFYKNEKSNGYIQKTIYAEVVVERILSDACLEKYKDEWDEIF
jgi:hypothetical protein